MGLDSTKKIKTGDIIIKEPRKEPRTRLKKLPDYSAKKSKKIAYMNSKGGCGKTTGSIALGLHLARSGYNVLFLDCDPQHNLSQRLGIPENTHPEHSMYYFFRNSDLEDFEGEMKKLGVVIKFPYFYRISGSNTKPGSIGIIAGHPYTETEAKSAAEKFNKSTRLGDQGKDIFQYFKEGLDFYCNYFDYIILDTSPAIEGNLLCQLAVLSVDEIIFPIDGLEAAYGVDMLINWVHKEIVLGNLPYSQIPNITFAMLKYQDDLDLVNPKELSLQEKNEVYAALKCVLGDYVCENGIKESRKLRYQVYGGFGGSANPYNHLCNEIFDKISTRRNNIFNYWDRSRSRKLQEALLKISEKSLKEKTPEIKMPIYTE
jgi:cellulose biosynthesis protein BcsQ